MTSKPVPSPLATLVQIICLAVAYYLAGRLAQPLASPPGNAIALYPPAGIALAFILIGGYRLWPGIWIGSFVFEIWTFRGAVDAGVASQSGVLAISAVMAAGALVQAIVSAALIRRVVSIRTSLDHAEDLFKMLALGGPIGCIISATFGVSTLVASGIIPVGTWPITWATWWIGDTIGVLIVAPLILVGWLQPTARLARWLASIALPVCVAVALSIVLFLFVRGWHEDRQRLAFEGRAATAVQGLRESLGVHLEVLHSIRSFFRGSQTVTRDEFRSFVERSWERHPGIYALEWIPRVTSAERSAFEASAQADGRDGFQIKERGPDGRMRRAGDRAEHFPVFYAEPMAGNATAMGYDLASNPARRAALDRARGTGEAVATAPIKLVQETDGQFGFLVILPVYAPGAQTGPAAKRRESLAGFVCGVFRIGDVVQNALAVGDRGDIEMCVLDGAIAESASPLYCTGDGGLEGGDDSMRSERTLGIAGRMWHLRFTPTSAFLESQRTWVPWAVLAGSLLFTGLLESFLLVVTGRTARIEELVEQRTAELRESRDAAEAASRAKSDFLANMSHELRTPLNAIMGFGQLLRDDARDAGLNDMEPDLDRILEASRHLLELIEGVLDLSKIESGRLELEVVEFDVTTLVSELATIVAPIVKGNGNELRVECPPGPWTIHNDHMKTRQVLLNLLSNAAKFTENGTITLEATAERDENAETGSGREWVRWDVSDTGIGIPEDKLDHVFDEFTQADSSTTRKYGGTGLGLAIARRFCKMMGGELTVASEVGRGSTFTVRLPVSVESESAPRGDEVS